jgi:D-alanyl-D-alanine carboxypeptidase/D-alanyl-D-alanine-endopeptidase (penicillin-binding protein 4)
MHRLITSAAALVALLLAGGGLHLANAAPPDDPLPPPVLAALQRAGVGPEALAAVALPLQHAAPPWRHRAEASMQPGSTMKVVTSIVALEVLGPNHRGFTELRSAAPLSEGVLQGDLVLKGGADPELTLAGLWAMLVDLRAAGVHTIAGDLLIDRTLFDPPRLDVGLPPFDESPEFPYNVIPDALHLAGNLLPLQLSSDGRAVRAHAVPALPALDIDASAMTINPARACRDWDDDWKPAEVTRREATIQIRLHGAYPPNCTQRVRLQLIDRLDLEQRLFAAVWAQVGGRWAGRAREAAAPAGSRVLVQRQGRPWGELLRPLNKTSDNAYTRLLYLSLGLPPHAAAASGDTRTRADATVRRWLARHGIDDAGLVLDNGSGLSRSERVTPLQLASMLRAAWSGPNAADLTMSLPTAGVDGSMRNRVKDSPATGWARLKTGTLRNVVALAGYVNDAQGRPWAVAMMVNHDQAGKARPALDLLVDHIARVGFTPPRRVGPQHEGP